MKNLCTPLIIFLTTFLTINNIYGQEPWTRIQPLPQESTIMNMQVIPGTSKIMASARYSTYMTSVDAGENWQIFTNPAGMCNLFHGGKLLFLDENKGFLTGGGNRILMTEDGGLNWSVRYVDNDGCDVGEGASDLVFTSPDTGFAIFQYHAVQTVNGGYDWEEIPVLFPGTNIAMAGHDTGYLEKISFHQWYKTVDGGITWNLEGFPASLTINYFSDILFTDNKTGFIYHYDNENNSKIFKTNDTGVTWFETEIVQTIPSFQGFIEFSDDGVHGMVVANTIDYRTKLLLTEDGGNTWHEVIPPGMEWYIYSALYLNNNDIILGGLNGNIYMSHDGGYTWQKKNERTLGLNIVNAQFTGNNTAYACGTCNEPGQFPMGCLYKSTDGGMSWFNLPLQGEGHYLICFLDSDTGFLLNSYYNYFYKTTDGGNYWQYIGDFGSSGIVGEMKFLDQQIGVVAGDESLLVTTNGGVTWTDVTPLDYTDYAAIDFTDEGEIVVADAYGTLYRSPDQGSTWTIHEFQNQLLGAVSDLFFKTSDSVFISTTYSKLYRSTNGGYSFEPLSLQMEGLMNLKEIYFANTSVGYIIGKGDTTNMLKTTDGGNTWFAISSGTTSGLNAIHFDDSNHGFILGQQGVCLKTSTGGVVTTDDHPLPKFQDAFVISPNPFGKTMNITFMDQPSFPAQLLITDLSGRTLKTYNITDRQKVVIQTPDLQPGVYLVTLIESSGKKSTVKGLVT